MSKLRLDWGNWIYGLAGGFIGGGSSAVIGAFTVMGITPESYNLHAQLGNTTKLIATVFILNGVLAAFMWLKQKPLPEVEVSICCPKEEVTVINKTSK